MTELIVGMIAGIVLTCWILYVMVQRAMRRAEHNLERITHVIEQLKQGMILARVEEEDGVFYIYNTQDSTFMAQGTTVAEIRQRIEQRWQDVSVYVTEGDKDVIERLKSTASQVEADRA